MTRLTALALVAGLAALPACQQAGPSQQMAPPMTLEGTAYDAASTVVLPETAPEEHTGLHNVYRLSDRIISGGEPESPDALAAIADMGVKTILSVDGKVPDAQTAASLGMRYVHVPIQYKGITDEELLQITKTFRELEGPFYVHCFHGKHRGPSAAAVGRVALDGVPREQALAEMRQWCGTSKKYEGLYGVVAMGALPDAETTAAYEFDFPAAQKLDGVAGLMVHVSRAYDRIKAMQRNAWQVNPDHPDIDPVNESAILVSLFTQAHELDEVRAADDDYRAWIDASIDQAASLREVVGAAREAGDGDWAASDAAFAGLDATCDACHAAYRN